MGLRLIFIQILFFCLLPLLIPVDSYSAWQGPTEAVNGIWGQGDKEFGIEKDETSDRLPELTAILFDGKMIISDQVNEREAVFNGDGTLFKVLPWDIYQNGTKITNPEYALYHYWNVQGFTPEGNIWMFMGEDYILSSTSGETLKTLKDKPLELGRVTEKKIVGQYKVTIIYPDKIWGIIGKGAFPKYMRDLKGNLYAVGDTQVARLNDCGKEMARLTMPEAKFFDAAESSDWPEGVEPPKPKLIEEYGAPVLAPNGDVYTWKRTPDRYSIVKWTWQDDPNAPANAPDAPTNLKVAPSTTGLILTWKASLQDPGCVSGYEIVRSETSGGPYTTLATLSKGIIKYEDTAVEAGKVYYYKVRAMFGGAYSEYSNETSGSKQ